MLNDLNHLLGISIEHWHPLLVHFPIALWLCGTLLFLLSMVPAFRWLELTSIILGVLGTAGGALAVWSGQQAAAEVGASLCSPQLLADHMNLSETAMIFFSGSWSLATLSLLGRAKIFKNKSAPLWLSLLISAGLILGSTFLVYSWSAGFKLVYFHGTGVQKQLTRCE